MSNALDTRDLGAMETFAQVFTDTRWFGLTNVAQGIVLIMAGRELGLTPYEAIRSIHIIEGKPSLASHAYASFLRKHPNYDYRVLEQSDEVCSIEFSGRRNGQWSTLGTYSVTHEKAERLGWTVGRKGPKSTWKKHPDAMLFARAISQGCRIYCPDVFDIAIYTADELDTEMDVEFVRSATVAAAVATPRAKKAPQEDAIDAEWASALKPDDATPPQPQPAVEPVDNVELESDWAEALGAAQ